MEEEECNQEESTIQACEEEYNTKDE